VKRSVAVGLTLAAGAAASWYILAPSGGDAEINGQLYKDTDACAADGRYTRDECISAFVNASEQHQQSAPRYATKEDCEADFAGSTCQPLHQTVADATPAFIPAMAGVVIAAGAAGIVGSALAATPAAVPVYRTCPPGTNPYYCRSSSYSGGWFFYSGGGYRVSYAGNASSGVSLARASFGSSHSTGTLARGGFGARAAAHGGGHGGGHG